MENTGIRDEVIQEIYTLAEKYNIKPANKKSRLN